MLTKQKLKDIRSYCANHQLIPYGMNKKHGQKFSTISLKLLITSLANPR